jgi:hypothetical protein
MLNFNETCPLTKGECHMANKTGPGAPSGPGAAPITGAKTESPKPKTKVGAEAAADANRRTDRKQGADRQETVPSLPRRQRNLPPPTGNRKSGEVAQQEDSEEASLLTISMVVIATSVVIGTIIALLGFIG